MIRATAARNFDEYRRNRIYVVDEADSRIASLLGVGYLTPLEVTDAKLVDGPAAPLASAGVDSGDAAGDHLVVDEGSKKPRRRKKVSDGESDLVQAGSESDGGG